MMCWNSLSLVFFPCQVLVNIFDEMEEQKPGSFSVFRVGHMVYEDSSHGAVFTFFIPLIPGLNFYRLLAGFTHSSQLPFFTL